MKRFCIPRSTTKFQTVISMWGSSVGVTDGAIFEKVRGFLQRRKNGCRRQGIAYHASDQHVCLPVVAGHLNFVVGVCFLNFECGMVMDAGKDSTAHECIESGIGVASWNVNTATKLPIRFPLNGDSMRSVFRSDAPRNGKDRGTNVSKSDQTDATDGVSVNDLGAKWLRKHRGHDVGVDAVVGQNSAVNDSADHRYSHETLLGERCVFGFRRRDPVGLFRKLAIWLPSKQLS